jgi:hypothetical protein
VSRRERLCAALAAVVGLAAGFAVLSPAPVGVFWDDGVYVITAKALATGQGYRFIHLPGAPAATHYPPLWPAILSLVWRVAPDFPENVRLMRLLNPVFLAVAAAGISVLAMRVARVPAWLAALIGASTLIVAPMLLLSAVLMSEPLCLAISAWAMVWATILFVRGRSRDGMIAGALVGLAILSRSAAIVLLPALAIGLFQRRTRRASAIALGVAFAFAVPWFVWSSVYAKELPSALAGSYGPYGTWILDGYRADPALLVAVISHNAREMFRESAIVIFGAFPIWSRQILLASLLLGTVWGLRHASRRVWPLLAALGAYTLLIWIWPYAPGRFIWTYFPLYATAAAASAHALYRAWRRKTTGPRTFSALYPIPCTLAVLALLSVVRYDVRGFQRGWAHKAIDDIADNIPAPVAWIASNTAPTDTIATDVHLQAYLYAQRIAVPITSLTVAEHLQHKSDSVTRSELMAFDATYHPRWWVASGMVSERTVLLQWALDSASGLRPVAQLPNGGNAVRSLRHPN